MREHFLSEYNDLSSVTVVDIYTEDIFVGFKGQIKNLLLCHCK